jgi:hypothetical protein
MARPAERARSILACHAGFELLVDGVPMGHGSAWGLQDQTGRPAFLCRPHDALAAAGRQSRSAFLSVRSGLDGSESLLLGGTLRVAETQTCDCCDRVRDQVLVEPVFVLLARGRHRTPVGIDDFVDPALQLNTGYLHRAQEHVNRCHGDLLREVVVRRTGLPATQVAVAQLRGLAARGVELHWVSAEGAHRTVLRFPRMARTPDHLGSLLRRSLHPDLC